jgi:hypothetical protein
MRSDLLGAAYHKGAHAVVGRSVGWVVVSIDISAGGGMRNTALIASLIPLSVKAPWMTRFLGERKHSCG